MKVLKFGGTSVGTSERIKLLQNIVPQNESLIVVLSAMSGTTNKLIEIADLMYSGKQELAFSAVEKLKAEYIVVAAEMAEKDNDASLFHKTVEQSFQSIETLVKGVFTKQDECVLLAQGELLSTRFFYIWLQKSAVKSTWFPALSFMKINALGEPDSVYIKEKIAEQLAEKTDGGIYVTQGFICLNHLDEVDNLRRGGSDYTASLIGAAIDVESVEIWTDISGFHNNDPRFVEQTETLEELSFEEAAELAYFGAKILHPSSVLPARQKNIPVKLKNTLDPKHPGTTIHGNSVCQGVRAIAAKDGITMINIRSGRMLLAYGFLRKVFEVFEKYSTPIDMITTSEVAVSLTIDSSEKLAEIHRELAEYGEITIKRNQSIVAVVGQLNEDTAGTAADVFCALKEIPLNMISYGGSKNNVSVLIDEENKVKALNDLSNNLLVK